MSPRSGTPVKLLGREDASVDWYNLEKSKRVKAFRCGEFDDCIERAEAAHGNLLKKREKYARREDAILHALELEKQQFQKIQGSLGINSNHMGVNNALSDDHYENNKTADVFNSESLMALSVSKKLSSFEEEDVAETLFCGKEKLMIEHGIEDGKSDMVQRMRGLQDFGLRTDSSKKKLPAPATLTDASNFKVPYHNNNNKNPLTAKKKRSHSGPMDETYVKKRDRRRPLVQVLQSSAKLPSFDPSTSHDEAVSMSMRGETVGPVFRAKRSKCVYFPADDYVNKVEYPLHEMQVADHPGNCSVFRSSRDEDTDFLQKNCYGQNMEVPTTTQSGSRMLSIREPSHSGNSTPKDQILETEELDGSMSSHGSHFHLNERTSAISANMGGSKWQLKGKRNIRNPSKRPSEVPDSNHFYSTEKFTDQGAVYESKENTIKKRSSQRALGGVLHSRKDDPIYDYYNDDEEEDDDECDQVNGDDGSRGKDLMDASMVEFDSKRYPLTSKIHHVQELRSDGESTDLDDESVPGVRGYWGEPSECFNPYYGNSYNLALVDVDLKVQVSYKREQVPLVSLMSRLNGKAIVGHPLQVEKLEEGFTEHLFPRYDIGDGPLTYEDDDDGNSGLQPVWRTARRTVMHRVPRSHPSAFDADDTDDTDFARYSDIENRSKSNVDVCNNKGRPVKKSNSRSQGPLSERKNSKKQSKKSCPSNQKTRTLSSIATEKRLSNPVSEAKGNQLPTKPEGATPSTCVPVKLVFSRLNKALEKMSPSQEKEQL